MYRGQTAHDADRADEQHRSQVGHREGYKVGIRGPVHLNGRPREHEQVENVEDDPADGDGREDVYIADVFRRRRARGARVRERTVRHPGAGDPVQCT